MDFRQGSKMSLLLQLQVLHALKVDDPGKWIVSQAVALVDDPSGFDSKVKLTAKEGNTTYTGFRTFKYNRIDLQTLRQCSPVTPPLAMSAKSKVYDCFPYLLKTMGILFDQNDLEDGDVVNNGDGTFTIPLVAKSACVIWKGSWQYKTGGLPHISLAITQPYFDWA